MFSESSSIEEGFNFPDTTKDLNFAGNKNFPKFKRRSKEAAEAYEDQEDPKPQTPTGNKLFFKIQVIKKVGTFLQHLKAGVVLLKPNLKQTELMYLQSETKQSEKSSMITHENIWVILLEALVVVALWTHIWKSSYEVIFSQLGQTPIIQSVTLVIYSLYVYFFLNTEFKNQKLQLISNREIILQYYINERLIHDMVIIGTLILQITPLDEYVPLFVIFRVCAVAVFKPLSEISKKLENIISISTDAEIILSILGLFFKILVLLHTLSLMFTSLSKIQKSQGIEVTWVEGNKELVITSEIEQYMVGWYWGATVLATVGFGDITPVSNFLSQSIDSVERFFFSFIEVMCCMIFGFFVNYIGALINMVGESKKIYEKDMRKLNRYLLKQDLPDQLKSNIRSHFFNKNKIQQVYDPSSEQTIMNKLTSHLTAQITETRNKKILLTSKFVRPFTEETVRKLSLVAKKMVFAPEQIIFSEKSKDMKLWILEDGVVEEIPTFFNQKQDKPITIYEKSQQKTIGWINFLTDKPYKTMARAKTFTLSYEIKQQDFFRIMRECEIDYNKLHELKQTLIQKKREYINKCLSCERFTHNVIQCPRIHFKSRGILKILLQQKKDEFLAQRPDPKKCVRSKLRFNWKSFESFSQYTPEIQGIVVKYNTRSQMDDEVMRRCSVDSFVHVLYRNKSSQQDKVSDKRSSEAMQNNPLAKNHAKIQPSEVNVEVNEISAQKIPVANYIDKVYLGEGNGYMEHHNFYEISKKYMLYIINLCTNRTKM